MSDMGKIVSGIQAFKSNELGSSLIKAIEDAVPQAKTPLELVSKAIDILAATSASAASRSDQGSSCGPGGCPLPSPTSCGAVQQGATSACPGGRCPAMAAGDAEDNRLLSA